MVEGRLGGQRVLVVDDSGDIVDSLAEILTDEGADEVRGARSLAEAERILARGWIPSAIVLDLLLGDGRGETLLHHMHGNPALSRVPVIVVSGDQGALASISGRVARTLLKPVEPALVIRALEGVAGS